MKSMKEGESMKRGFPSYKGEGGPGVLPREIFKIGLPKSAFPCYFQAIFINSAG